MKSDCGWPEEPLTDDVPEDVVDDPEAERWDDRRRLAETRVPEPKRHGGKVGGAGLAHECPGLPVLRLHHREVLVRDTHARLEGVQLGVAEDLPPGAPGEGVLGASDLPAVELLEGVGD